MNKLNDYEDEKADVLLRKVLKEEAENINVPDSIKEEIDEKIEKKKNMSEKLNKKIGVCILAGISLLGSFGTAYAANPAFRESVHSLLFPLYTLDEIVSIDNGHMTGSFDKTDVLLSFLDKFNKEEFGNSITVAKENGYHYGLFAQNENQLLAFVDSSVEGYCIVVYMERIAYEGTEGIWQVTGYQISEKPIAENMKNQLEPYSDKPAEETISVPQEDIVIKGTKDSVIIYNVNEKKNVVSINEDDGKIISDILNACDRSEDITGGLFQYVIKINDTSYMFDSDGNGMVDAAGNRWGITINENELGVIKELFEQYNVSLIESGEVFSPTFKDEDGKLYVAALFKEMTESTVTVDVIEFITDADVKRIKELNLTENEMPDGYYIYNQDTETVTWNLDSQTVYMFIDWNGDFTDSEYPEEYTTTDLQEFRKYIETYQDAAPGMPFFFQIENGVVRLILEKQIA